MKIQLDKAYLVYVDSKGNYHKQPATYVQSCGSLIDEYTDEEMELDHIEVIQ